MTLERRIITVVFTLFLVIAKVQAVPFPGTYYIFDGHPAVQDSVSSAVGQWRIFGIEELLGAMFPRQPSQRVNLPPKDISTEFDLGPGLKAYDPSYVDFPPPPHAPEVDGYKLQFVCDYDYVPEMDPGNKYLDFCFYYMYAPKTAADQKQVPLENYYYSIIFEQLNL